MVRNMRNIPNRNVKIVQLLPPCEQNLIFNPKNTALLSRLVYAILLRIRYTFTSVKRIIDYI